MLDPDQLSLKVKHTNIEDLQIYIICKHKIANTEMTMPFRNIAISYIIDHRMVWSYDFYITQIPKAMGKEINLHIDLSIMENTLIKKMTQSKTFDSNKVVS